MRSFIIRCVGAFAALQTVGRVMAVECPPLHILGALELEPAECVSYNLCVGEAGPVKLSDYKLPCETPLIALRCRHDLQTINPDGTKTQCDYSILEFGDDGSMRRACCEDGDGSPGTESHTQRDGSRQVPLQPDDVETPATEKPKKKIVHDMEDSLPELDESPELGEHDRCESCSGGKLTTEEEGEIDDTETFKLAEGEEPFPGEEWEWEFEDGDDDQPWSMDDDQDAEEDHDSPLEEEGEEWEHDEEKEAAGDEIPEQEHVYNDEHLGSGNSERHEDGTGEANNNDHPAKEPPNQRLTEDEPEWPWADQEHLGEEEVEERHNVRYHSDPRTPKDRTRPPKLDANDPSYVWACYCNQGEAEQRILLSKL